MARRKQAPKQAEPEEADTPTVDEAATEEVGDAKQAEPEEAEPEAVTLESLEREAAIDVFQVIEDRYLYFMHIPSNPIWARGGQYVRANHPVLLEMVQQQMAKVNKVASLPTGAKVVEITFSDVLNLLAGYSGSEADKVATEAASSEAGSFGDID
ncbi:MAG: hypothetical protein JKY61_12350 [Planctomycetes bacterium]|nr:hypothetical protein [Planctomycetota bacterium]